MGTATNSLFVPEDFDARRRALLQAVHAQNANMVAVFGFGSALGMSAKSHGAFRYLSGFDSHEALSLLVFDTQGALLLLNSPFLVELAGKACPDVNVIAAPPANWPNEVAKRFPPAPVIATIGFGDMPNEIRSLWDKGFSQRTYFGADAILAQNRAAKSAKELATMEAGAAICDGLFATLEDHLAPDQPVWKTQLQLESAARLAGADYCKTWLTIRPVADRPRYWPEENERCPKRGDQILFGIALTVDGYWAHGIRMGSIGPIDPAHMRLWAGVHDALMTGRERLQAGAAMADIDSAMTEVLQMLPSAQPTARFRNGHGLGTSYEEPLTTNAFLQAWGDGAFAEAPQSLPQLQRNAVIELHPNIFIHGQGGAALGEMYVVTDQPPRALLKFPLEPFEINDQAYPI